jgi:hypothetical protein
MVRGPSGEREQRRVGRLSPRKASVRGQRCWGAPIILERTAAGCIGLCPIQMVSYLWWVHGGVFDVTMLQECCAFNRNQTLSSEFGSSPGLALCSLMPSWDAGWWQLEQLLISLMIRGQPCLSGALSTSARMPGRLGVLHFQFTIFSTWSWFTRLDPMVSQEPFQKEARGQVSEEGEAPPGSKADWEIKEDQDKNSSFN